MKKAALITGAAKRIGAAMALGLARSGYDIALHYRTSNVEAREVAAEIEKLGRKTALLSADLGQEAETSRLVAAARKEIGSLSLLVNSASVFEQDDVLSMTRESWDKHMETNLRAPLKLAQDFASQAEASQDNLIVNIIDQRVLKLTPQFLSYTASKAALFALTTTLAQALGPKNIRVNAIGPGPTMRNPRQSEDDWRRQNASTVLGRGATADDVVDALLYLACARSVTGQMIAVDGGQHLAWRTADVLVKE
jgi:NAD(P)-dependent dehydrogenase (short-subunit alcohol dehydrogenase family)